jgi:hypothetical protein
MTIQELIDELMKIKDKNQPVLNDYKEELISVIVDEGDVIVSID